MGFFRDLTIKQKQIVWAWAFLALPVLFYVVIASLVIPSILISLGVGLIFNQLGWDVHWSTSGFGAQLTWTLPFGLLIMFAVFNRFDKSYEEAASPPAPAL